MSTCKQMGVTRRQAEVRGLELVVDELRGRLAEALAHRDAWREACKHYANYDGCLPIIPDEDWPADKLDWETDDE